MGEFLWSFEDVSYLKKMNASIIFQKKYEIILLKNWFFILCVNQFLQFDTNFFIFLQFGNFAQKNILCK